MIPVADGKKVLFITYYWPPSGGAGVQRSLKFVKYLSEFGWKPYVLTVDPEKAFYPVEDPTLLKEVASNVAVIKTPSFEPLKILSAFSGKKSVPYGGFTNRNKEKWTQRLLRFIRGNFFIPDARIGWVRHAVKAASDLILREQISTIVISSPPHSSQLIGLRLKKRFPSLKWVADLRDPWTDIYYYNELLHTSPAAAKDARLERDVVRQCDAAVVVSDPIRDSFLKKVHDVDAAKFHVLPNGFDRTDFSKEIKPPSDVFRITYVGTMADSYRPQAFLYAMKDLMQAEPDAPIRLRMVGSSATLLPAFVAELGLSSVIEYIPHVAHAEAVCYMRESSVLLLVIPDTEHAAGILTGKLFEYLGAGLPVVGLGPKTGKAAAILRECSAGRMFERNEVSELKSFLHEQLLQWKKNSDLRHMGDVSKYERRSQAGQLALILNSISN